MHKKFITLLALLLCLSSCFGGVDKRGSVIGYYNGIVRTKGGSFKIGTLPAYWKRKELKYRALLFHNTNDQSSITIDSWCKGAFDDGTLQALTRQLYLGIDNFKIIERRKLNLADRAALLTNGQGTVDGEPVYLSMYVLKKDECVFDFVYYSSPDQLHYYDDFNQMVQGFRFIQGPKLL